MSLAKRSVDSVTWNALSNIIKLPVGFIQSIILARFLPVEYFGIYGGVIALVTVVNQIFDLGLNAAFIHRSQETNDEKRAIEVLFTLRVITSTIQAVILGIIAICIFSDLRQYVLIVLTITGYFTGVFSIPKVLLTRRIQFKRLALLNLSSAIITAIASILIAWFTSSIWALLVSSILTLLWMVIVLYLWKPVWLPRFAWDKPIVKYFINFGIRVQISNFISVTLDNIDDLWTNVFLGNLALGFYSRAFKFATYPRTILALPVQSVANSTYSELKGDRKRLSQAFFRVNALLIRTGFMLSGWLFIIAPQFIILLLGEKWFPMLDVFRLMLVFALFDPLKDAIGNVLVAIGIPQKLIVVRFIQLFILISGLFILGPHLGIVGVAIAIDTMLVVGIGILYAFVRPFVDFSFKRLFLAPLIALGTSISLTWILFEVWNILPSDWLRLISGSIGFLFSYLGVLSIFEGKILYQTFLKVVRIASWGNLISKIIQK